jgi:RNA polymerase sigma-70 factor (ECF subfamily)
MEFGEFYEDSRRGCLNSVAVVVGDRWLAEDLVAEAYARAFARWSKLAAHPDPRAWVLRTALNLNVSRWRRRRREVRAPDPGGADATSPDATEATLVSDVISAAVAELPLRQRQVIALRIFVDLDTAQTAQVLGIAEGTVTAHLHRATATLKQLLTPTTDLESTR